MITYYGKYRARVVNNEDPEYRGRVRVTCPLVYGENVDSEELNWSPWCLPCFPYGGSLDKGFCAVPEKGSFVWIEFEQGDPDKPIWVGSWIGTPGEIGSLAPGEFNRREGTGNRFAYNNEAGWDTQDDATIPPFSSEPNRIAPTNKVFRTSKGHTIELDDTDGYLKIKITDSVGQYLLFRPEDGQGGGPHVTLKGAHGQYIYIDGVSGQKKIELKDAAGNFITLDAEDGSVHVEDQEGDYVDLKSGLVDIFAKTDVYVHTLASRIIVEAEDGEIRLNSDGGLVNVYSKHNGKINIEGTSIDVESSGILNIHSDSTVNINGAGQLRLQGGGPAIARVGDAVSGGHVIIEGSDTARCG